MEILRFKMVSPRKKLQLLNIAIEIEIQKLKILTKRRRRHRWWVSPLCADRHLTGEYHRNFALLCESDKFTKYYRVSYEEFLKLLKVLEPTLQKDATRRKVIEPGLKLSATLRFLISGGKVCDIAKEFKIGIATCSNIINTTTRAIWELLRREYLPDPTHDTWEASSIIFGEKWNFPQCCGAIDGKHVNIICPGNTGSQFYNYKERFSIVLLAVCDGNYKFLYINVGGYGSQSDGGTFRASSLGQAIAAAKLSLPGLKLLPNFPDCVPGVLVGDEAFPLSTYLMRPYSRIALTPEKRSFNYRLSRARRCIENAFGILRQRFGFYGREIQMKVENVEAAVKATIILHNFLIQKSTMYCSSTFADHFDSLGNIINGDWRTQEFQTPGMTSARSDYSRNPSQSAVDIRNTFCRFFNSPAGAISWQNHINH